MRLVRALERGFKKIKMPSTTNFKESDYLQLNPDVAAAVKAKQFTNGLEHYLQNGKKEGRQISLNQSNFSARENVVFHLIDRKGMGFEIGPSHNPIAPKKKVIMSIF